MIIALKILFVFAALAVGIYTLFLAIAIQGWLKLPVISFKRKDTYHTTVSVVIAARNEEQNIENVLSDLAAQTYNSNLVEIVIADDASNDSTANTIKTFIAGHPQMNIKLVELQDEADVISYKKRALSAAITASSGKLILTTDADCRFGPQWIESIVSYYEEHPVSLILLPVVFSNERSVFEMVQSLEFTGIMGITAASAALGKPVSANGANMAIERKLFERLGGFDDAYASGDDVFVLYKAKKHIPKRIAFLIAKESIVYTQAQKTLSGFFNQRVRWGAKAKGYTDVAALTSILLLFFSNAAVTLTLAVCIFFPGLLIPALGIFFLKLLADIIFLVPVTRYFGKLKLLPLYPITSLWLPFYITVTGILSLRGNYIWKGRKLH